MKTIHIDKLDEDTVMYPISCDTVPKEKNTIGLLPSYLTKEQILEVMSNEDMCISYFIFKDNEWIKVIK